MGEESRSSTPEIPKTPEYNAPEQLPIPKLRIKLPKLSPAPKISPYKPVKVITGPRQSQIQPTVNCFANKLGSLGCKVNVPRLKFKVLDDDSETLKNARLHEKDIEALAEHRVSMVSNVRKKSERDLVSKQVDRPPIAPIKIRLRTTSETTSNSVSKTKSLLSVLAEIVPIAPTVPERKPKELSDFMLPEKELPKENKVLFSSSLSESCSALVKFVEMEICRDIVYEVVKNVEESRAISGDIIHEIFDDIFFNELCCANILDNLVGTVVENVETKKEQYETERRADIMAQRKFMEQQRLRALEKSIDSSNKNQYSNSKHINHGREDYAEFERSNSNENCTTKVTEALPQQPEVSSNLEVYVSDDESSIELSDSEFDLDGENPSLIEELKYDNSETEPHADCEVENISPKETQLFEEPLTSQDIEETEQSDERSSTVQQASREKDQSYSERVTHTHVDDIKKPSENSEEKLAKANSSKKKNKIPKLLIKPIKRDDEHSVQENFEAKNTRQAPEKDEGDELPKMPPIIVKIPKQSISTKKSPKKEYLKSPVKNCIKKLNFSLPKQPTVTIKNLKILPPMPPEVTEAILELADEIVPETITKEEKKISTPHKKSPIKQIPPKVKLQTPPPLSVIKNKKKVKSPEVTNSDEKDSVVTVLKMKEIVSMKQKEESAERLNDLEKLLEKENKLKIEDRKRQQEVKEKVAPETIKMDDRKKHKEEKEKVTPETTKTDDKKRQKEDKEKIKTEVIKKSPAEAISSKEVKKEHRFVDTVKDSINPATCEKFQNIIVTAKKSPPKAKVSKSDANSVQKRSTGLVAGTNEVLDR